MPRPLDLQPFVRPLAIGAAVVVLVGGGLIARALFTRTTAEAAVSATETLPETPPPVPAAAETLPETPPPVSPATETAPVAGAVAISQPGPTRVPAIGSNSPAGATATATRASVARPASATAPARKAAAVVSSAPEALTVSSAPPVIAPSPLFSGGDAACVRAGASAGARPSARACCPPAGAHRPFARGGGPHAKQRRRRSPPIPAGAGRVAAPASGRLYSVQDEDVEPPVFLRQQLPVDFKPDSEPSASYIEVTVDERGQVAQVRLRSTDASLNDRMIVAAAKAWQFRPAVKDGRPVPYVLTVPVTR